MDWNVFGEYDDYVDLDYCSDGYSNEGGFVYFHSYEDDWDHGVTDSEDLSGCYAYLEDWDHGVIDSEDLSACYAWVEDWDHDDIYVEDLDCYGYEEDCDIYDTYSEAFIEFWDYD